MLSQWNARGLLCKADDIWYGISTRRENKNQRCCVDLGWNTITPATRTAHWQQTFHHALPRTSQNWVLPCTAWPCFYTSPHSIQEKGGICVWLRNVEGRRVNKLPSNFLEVNQFGWRMSSLTHHLKCTCKFIQDALIICHETHIAPTLALQMPSNAFKCLQMPFASFISFFIYAWVMKSMIAAFKQSMRKLRTKPGIELAVTSLRCWQSQESLKALLFPCYGQRALFQSNLIESLKLSVLCLDSFDTRYTRKTTHVQLFLSWRRAVTLHQKLR